VNRSEREDFDNISPEEAKERLLREYEKRGISREEARRALIKELIKLVLCNVRCITSHCI
jgi:hypothetical protein